MKRTQHSKPVKTLTPSWSLKYLCQFIKRIFIVILITILLCVESILVVFFQCKTFYSELEFFFCWCHLTKCGFIVLVFVILSTFRVFFCTFFIFFDLFDACLFFTNTLFHHFLIFCHFFVIYRFSMNFCVYYSCETPQSSHHKWFCLPH